MAFQLLAAIDLLHGQVVRLRQGEFSDVSVFSDDPAEVAVELVEAGVRWLHVVDLDGARTGTPAHADQIARLIEAVAGRASVEVGGGLRDEASIDRALANGASRVVLGTAALADPGLAGTAVQRHGAERVAVAIDVRNGRAVSQGWSAADAGPPPLEAMTALAAEGVTTFEVTAVARDGMLDGPDLDLLRTLVHARVGDIIAAGGIRSIDDIESIRRVGCAGAIVGRALYEGRLDLAGMVLVTRQAAAATPATEGSGPPPA